MRTVRLGIRRSGSSCPSECSHWPRRLRRAGPDSSGWTPLLLGLTDSKKYGWCGWWSVKDDGHSLLNGETVDVIAIAACCLGDAS